MRRQAIVVPLLGLLGLAAGFGREMIVAALFGTSPEIEVFRIATGLPSVVLDSAAVSLVSLMVPLLMRPRERIDPAALGGAMRSLALVGALVALAGCLTMPLQARLLAPGFGATERESLVLMGRVCWLASLCALASLPARALLSARGQVWPGAALQLMRSGGFLLALLLGLALLPPLAALGLAALGTGLSVLGVHAVALGARGRARLLRETVKGRGIDRTLAIGALSVMGAQVLLSGGRLMDRAAASAFPRGTVAALEFSYGLLMAAAALFGTTASLFVAPAVTRALRAGQGVPRAMLARVSGGLGLTLALGLALALMAEPIVALVFGRGAFGADDIAATAGFFRLHAIGLAPVVGALVMAQFVLVLGGVRAVVGIAAAKLGLKAALLWSLLASGFGKDALTLSLIGSETFACLAMAGYVLARRGAALQPAE